MKVLELYSGIGGMHLALTESGVPGKIVASIEINNVANEIYKHNFPNTNLLNMNIEGITSDFINRLNVDTILMSPPCQPFTRNGLQNDVKDPRTASFVHILKLLPEITIKNILVENVKGFETSKMREILIDTLKENNYVYQEFILSPSQFGISNTRHRYYCLAKKLPQNFNFETGSLMEKMPFEQSIEEPPQLEQIVEENVNKKYYLNDETLKKRMAVLDICCKDSKRSCCFTKSYGRYLEGTGSIFSDKVEKELQQILDSANDLESSERLDVHRTLKLRFFTPSEVCRLMCFPDYFSFPKAIGDRKRYAVLGNSVNVKVVSELIKLLR